MINFIICEDNKHVREINEGIISKIAMPYDFNYKVFSFDDYNGKLKSLINTPSDLKIYILDIELPNKSGVDIAREIRKVDWDSIIIILTSHAELEMKLLKDKLLIFDFISKFDNYEKKLSDSISIIWKKINKSKLLCFKSNKSLHHVKLDNILFIHVDKQKECNVIVTHDNEYEVRDSLSSIMTKLDKNFCYSHRACIVNKERIIKIDFVKDIIYFNGNKTADFLSRQYKKGLREKND
ncbi:MAG: LytTR family DNA-binding domain-containing protein [Bacilli bacterium]